MDHEEALDRIDQVRRIVERTAVYNLLPGVPSVIGGCMVLAGCVASVAMMGGSLDFMMILSTPVEVQAAFCVMWTVIGLGAIALEVVLVARRARQLGGSPMARPNRLAALSLSPSIFVAIVLTIHFLNELDVRLIAPVWMMCYGTGVYTAGLLSVRLPRILGLAFILLGGLGLAFLSHYGVVLIAVSFGLLHILFGIEVIRTVRGEERT